MLKALSPFLKHNLPRIAKPAVNWTNKSFVATISTSKMAPAAVETLKTLSAEKAAALDADLMSEEGGFSIDQLMELAGLSVSQAVYAVYPPSPGKNRVLIACGPGNNGGDGLVAARHLHQYGYAPVIYYPKPTKKPIFEGLQKQLHNLHIPFENDKPFADLAKESNFIVDSLFGFSFKPPVRDPFPAAIEVLESTKIPVLAVDIPSSWHVENGPQKDGLGANYMPDYLISLTAPKPNVQFFKGKKHFIGGRFLPKDVAKKYGLELPPYEGVSQILEVPVDARVEKL